MWGVRPRGDMLKVNSHQDEVLPRPWETCAVPSLHVVKRACLLFDRVWIPPPGVTSTPGKIWNPSWLSDIPHDARFFVYPDRKKGKYIKQKHPDLISRFLDRSLSPKDIGDLTELFTRAISDSCQLRGVAAVPIYPDYIAYSADFSDGRALAYQGALLNLPIVLETDLAWEQVREFRKDKESCRKYLALRTWISDGIDAGSVGEAVEVIGKKVNDYEWAIKKHGLKTAVGALSSVLELKSISAIAAGSSAATLFGGPIWGAIAGGLLVGAKAATWLADRMIDLEDVRRGPGSEIALIFDLRREYGNNYKKV